MKAGVKRIKRGDRVDEKQWKTAEGRLEEGKGNGLLGLEQIGKPSFANMNKKQYKEGNEICW